MSDVFIEKETDRQNFVDRCQQRLQPDEPLCSPAQHPDHTGEENFAIFD